MNTLIKIFLLCPIPEDQKPIHEYIGLKNNALLNTKNFFFLSSSQTFLAVFFLSSLVFSIFFLQIGIFVINIFFLMFFLLFFRWNQVNKRFQKARLFYEEASWYDGQMWEKPSLLLKNDRLLSTQQIFPFLERMQTKFFICTIINIVFVLLFVLK